jgi:hypothetical protein
MSRAAALRRNEVVKGVDLGVEHLESLLAVDAVLADRGGLARGHRLEKLNAVRSAAPVVMSSVHASLARNRPAIASGSDVEGLAAIRGFNVGDRYGNGQNCDEQHSDAQHECNPVRRPHTPPG